MTDERAYHALPDVTHEEFERIRSADSVDGLHRAIVSLALTDGDRVYVEAACIGLATHQNELVRGNAILGLGHLARRFGELSTECLPVIERGLRDASVHVRGQAWAAADDAVFFLKWTIRGFDPGDTDIDSEAVDDQ